MVGLLKTVELYMELNYLQRIPEVEEMVIAAWIKETIESWEMKILRSLKKMLENIT
jgi:uncharacterized alkaline shock family protein YloU